MNQTIERWSAAGSGCRALALLQLAKGASAPQIASVVPLTFRPFGILAGATSKAVWIEHSMKDRGQVQAEVLDESQKQRFDCNGVHPPEGRARWTVRLVAEEAVKRKLGPQVGVDPRSEAVAGEKCGWWPTWMTTISPRWRMSWKYTRAL
jgi:hypothetical protein